MSRQLVIRTDVRMLADVCGQPDIPCNSKLAKTYGARMGPQGRPVRAGEPAVDFLQRALPRRALRLSTAPTTARRSR